MMKYRRDQDNGHEKRIVVQGKPKLDNRKGGEGVEVENGGNK